MRTTSTGPIERCYAELLAKDRALRRLADVHGLPDPFVWDDGQRGRSSNFAAMMLHITSQQISTSVAFVLFDRVRDAVHDEPDPHNIVVLGEQGLRELGLSRAKASYLVNLAQMHLDGALDTDRLDQLPDDEVVARLTSARGVGRWTADMFLIHQLRRPDVLPAGDLGIRRAVQQAWALSAIPTIDDVVWRGMAWAPYRTYASALLWASLKAGKIEQEPRVPLPRR